MGETDKGLLELVRDLLKSNPEMNDVQFCVGEEKRKVMALKVLLMAASPVFASEFQQNWTNAGDGGVIQLSDFDPDAFELFVRQLQLDAWSKEHFEELNLSPPQLLNMMPICHHFKIKNAIRVVKEQLRPYLSSFHQWSRTDDVVSLSRGHLLEIIRSEMIYVNELHLFKAICRWAENQCNVSGLEATNENLIHSLGEILSEIRFPLMTNTELTQAITYKNLLTLEQRYSIYYFIGNLETNRSCGGLEESCRPFSTVCRKRPFEILDLTKSFDVVSRPSISRERFYKFTMKNKEKIILKGIGFLGPLDEDSCYEVIMQVFDKAKNEYLQAEVTKSISAKRGRVFHFLFDPPLTVDARTLDTKLVVEILYRIEGPATQAFKKSGAVKVVQLEQECEFGLEWSQSQIAEMLFTKADF